MSLDEKFVPVRITVIDFVSWFFEELAQLFGYPRNPGMPTMYDKPSYLDSRAQFINDLPQHNTFWPPVQRPESWFEMIFGPTPKVEAIPRYMYESSQEGFYNFYVENYKNMYFLPDWLSEFIQIRLNICLDISILETIREVLFVGLMVYSQLVILRIALSWFIYINPYTFPWYYIAAAVDWTEDVLQGIVPAILGVNITGSIFLGILGVVADSLNHLVFTMPFLPSEAEETQLLINDEMKNVLVFHYLPILWYRYPIPNEIRQFWYRERPEILNYMQKSYLDLDVQFLPDQVIKNLDQLNKLKYFESHGLTMTDHFSTHVLSTEFFNNVNFLNHHFHDFFK